MPAILDIRIDRIAHFAGPVFVVSHGHDAFVVLKDFRPKLQIDLPEGLSAGEIRKIMGGTLGQLMGIDKRAD